jgi:type II secretion system protein L
MLILGLPHSAEADLYEYVISQDGVRTEQQGSATATELPQAAQVVGVIPLSRLAWQSVKIPALSRAQRRAAVLGLLEDQWLQTPQTLHISTHAVEPVEPDQDNLWVCTCDALWLRQVLEPLIQRGLMPQRLIPEFAPASPGHTESVYFMGPADAPAVVWCRPQGVLWSPLPVPWPLLQATPAESWAEPVVMEAAQLAMGPKADTLKTQTRAERWLAACQRPWDLAQGEWSQTRSQRWLRLAQSAWQAWSNQPAWRPVRWSLSALILAQCLGLLAWSWLMRQELQSQRRELDRILTQTFPQTPLVVDAAQQMRQSLQRLRQQVGAPHPAQAEVMLDQLAGSRPQPASLQGIRFEGQTLVVQGLRLSDLEAGHVQSLQAKGYVLKATADGLSMTWEGEPW